MSDLESQIDRIVGEIRTETVDFSFGELGSLHEKQELRIQPEYQRLFRWSDVQKSRLVESLLISLPVPPIFVIENDDGVYELIDGLQRVSSVFQFFDSRLLELEPLRLTGCELIPQLNGMLFSDLPLSLRLRLKRVPARTVVIKRQSRQFLRYEMFKRLNTGGSLLSPQEIRNCSARMLGESGATFYSFLLDLAKGEDFAACTQTLPQEDSDQKGAEELVLRFFAAKNSEDDFKGSVRDWLDTYMENVLVNKKPFDYSSEKDIFTKTFQTINYCLGETAFVKHRDGQPMGGLAPAYFEAISIAFCRLINHFPDLDPSQVRPAVIAAVQSHEFRSATGPGANSKQKLKKRVECIEVAINSTL